VAKISFYDKGDMMYRLFIFLSALLIIIVPAKNSNAISITYDTAYLSGNTWQYTYYISDYGLGDEITISSGSTGKYDTNADVSPLALAGGEILLSESVVSVSVDGDVYDALEGDPFWFTVNFILYGVGNPSSQFFEVLNPGLSPIIGQTIIGQTMPIPEPATMLLLGSGLIGLVGLRRKFKKK
jgi:hypothetical protein